MTKRIFRYVFSEDTYLVLSLKKKLFWWLIADFEIKEELKLINQLKNMSKKIPTKHINMANVSYEQDHD